MIQKGYFLLFINHNQMVQLNLCIKLLKNYIIDYLYTYDGEKFSIETALLNAIEKYNFSKHSSTKYIPWDLKDSTDTNLNE